MSFQRFYNRWLTQFHNFTNQLKESTPPDTDEANRRLSELVQKTLVHHKTYYQVNSLVARRDLLQISTAAWKTDMERCLSWLCGWRPTTAFHVIYTEASVRFECQIIDIIRGVHTGDLGDLSPCQFRRVSELQCETLRQETEITDEYAKWQDGAYEMEQLSENAPAPGMSELAEVVERADGLRVRTLEKIVELLTPQQAAEFLIAGSQLHTGVHGCGVEYDNINNNSN